MSKLLLAFGAAALIAAACANPPPPSPATGPASQASTAAFDLEELTIADLQQRMTSGQDTSRSLVEKYLARIDALDRQRAGAAQRHRDQSRGPERRRSPRRRAESGPSFVGRSTASRSLLRTTSRPPIACRRPPVRSRLRASRAGKDAFIVARLRDAGAVLLGKTNLCEWANFRVATRHRAGAAAAARPGTRMRWIATPSGSSSGSGAAVAANLAAAAVGTETDGSIVSPPASPRSSGIKPTHRAAQPHGHRADFATARTRAGPMARTVADAASLLGAMAGVGSRDASTTASRAGGPSDYSRIA